MTDYNPDTNSSRRPKNRFEAAKVFLECVSCGAYKVLAQDHDLLDKHAAARAHRSGWSIAGFRGAKTTRCRLCRSRGVRHRRFAEKDRRYGAYTRRNPLLTATAP